MELFSHPMGRKVRQMVPVVGLTALALTVAPTIAGAATTPSPAHRAGASASGGFSSPRAYEGNVGSTSVLSDTLLAGETLTSGHSLESPSGRFALVMDSSGDLLLLEEANMYNASVYTVSYGDGEAGSRLSMQADGNLVLYGVSDEVFSSTDTYGSGATRLQLQDDGNLVLYTAADQAVYAFDTNSPTFLLPGGTLLPGERLVSADHGTSLVMQTDGNLVLYTGHSVRFATGTGEPGSGAVLQEDGNFVVYSGTGQPLFSTVTSTPAGAQLELVVFDREFGVTAFHDDGRVEAVYSNSWTTPTLEQGMVMVAGDRRTAGNVLLLFQTDGNLVLYVNGSASFSTGPGSGDFAIMQPDGNFVVYQVVGESNVPTFDTGTFDNAASRLVVQSDGNLVVYTPENSPIFSLLG